MLPAIDKMKETTKWGIILDCNGNVGTFMKYKKSYFENILQEITKEKMVNFVLGALPAGDVAAIDFDIFPGDGALKEIFNEEWVPNIMDKAKF